MQNELLRKYLIPYYVSAVALLTGTGLITANLAQKDSALSKMINEKNSDNNYLFCAILIAVSLLVAGFNFIVTPKRAKKKINEITKQFLQDMFSDNKNLKQYEHILNNPQKILEISTVACNGLNKKEQEEIIKIIKKASIESNNSKSDYEEKEIFRKAEEEILKIVKNHSINDGEYLTNILSISADKHSIYLSTMYDHSR